jgi:hypothetical protein
MDTPNRIEQFLLVIDERIVRVALHDTSETVTTVVLVAGDDRFAGILPITVEEPATLGLWGESESEPEYPGYPEYPWFPMSLRASAALEAVGPYASLHVDTSDLPPGMLPFRLDSFVDGVREALSSELDGALVLTRSVAEEWGARFDTGGEVVA